MADQGPVRSLIESSLRLAWLGGGVRPIGTHSTGWRALPGTVFVQVLGLRTEVLLGERGVVGVATPGMGITVDTGARHRLDSVEVGRGVSRWAHLRYEVLGGVSPLALVDVAPVHSRAVGERIGRLCAEGADVLARPASSAVAAGARRFAIGAQLLATVVDGAPPTARGAALAAHAPRLAGVLAHIDARLAESLSRASLARAAGLAPSRFHELFVATVGVAPMAYVARRRVQRAQALLVQDGVGVQAAAEAVGFADPFHFSRVFRRLVGQSPRAWRERTREAQRAMG